MNRKAFHGLLKKYLDGKCTEEERVIVDKWYDLLDDTGVQASAEDDGALEDRLWDKIHGGIGEVRPGATPGSRVLSITGARRKYGYAAAIVIVLAGIGLLFLRKKASAPQIERPYQELATRAEGDRRQVIVLEDGSKVTLGAGSKLDYPTHFGKTKREVYLSGEAFFEVTKDPAKPFFVYNNNLVTEVLGTSFNVKAVRTGIEVAVRTGKVAVYENGSKITLSDREKLENGVIVTPNQKVIYYAEARHFITSIVDVPLPLPPSTGTADTTDFVYDDTPLANVLASIEKAYDIEIVLENERIRNCPFTGDLTKPSLYHKLEFICQALGASYEIKGTRILIKGGRSCN